MDDAKSYSFAEAIHSPADEVCSVVLRPFSLGAWTFLELYGSPLLSEKEYPDAVSIDPNENMNHCIRHVLLFLIVCAHSYEENVRLYEDAEFFKQVLATFEEGFLKHIKKTKHWNIYSTITSMKDYLSYYINSMPAFVETGTPSPPSGIDWKANIYSVLKNEYSYSQSEIMNMSMRRIWVEWVTYAAKSGSIKVKPKQQVESEKLAKEQLHKFMAEKKALAAAVQ